MDIRDVSELNRKVAEGREEIRQGLLGTLPQQGRIDRERLRWIAKADRAELWRGEGARNMAQWLSALCHISNWKAHRWVAAAHTIETLPLTAAALETGSLSLDKTVELIRFATPADEKKLVKWARRVTVATIRTRADEAHKRSLREAEEAQRARYLRAERWDDHVEIEALLPLEQGTALMNAVDELAQGLPEDPDTRADGELGPTGIEQRRADALVLLATRDGSDRAAPATVVVHAPLEALAQDGGGCSVAGGGVLHPETARRVACDARLQVVLEGKDGNALGIGRSSRIVPEWLRRQVLRRDDNTCTFPGCDAKTFLHAHHVQHWSRGGRTDLDNLITLCTFHHKLVHEGRWSVTLDQSQRPIWFRPGGRVHDPGPAPPTEVLPLAQEPPTVAEAAGYSPLFALLAPLERRRRGRRRGSRVHEIPEWGRIELGLETA